MATDNTAADFDLGPLSWVQGEIDQAIARGLDALAAHKANPDDDTPQAVAQDAADDRARGRAQDHADPDFVRASAHAESHHAVQTN